MRSRFAAFALGLGGYLVETLAEGHEDRRAPPDVLARELGRVRERQKFLGLVVLEASENGDTGEVLFHARVFERGRDRSFAELSTFVREADGAWRYEGGILVPREALPTSTPAALTREAFLEAAGRLGS